MKVAIIGAGAIGLGATAFLCARGHDPIVWSPSGARALAGGAPLTATGALAGAFRPRIAKSASEAVGGAEVVLVAVPGYGHRAVLDAIAPHVQAGQTVVISGHLSFGALYLRARLRERGVDVPIVAFGTTVTTGRRTGAAEVRVANVRKLVDMATVPQAARADGLALCTHLFGERFVARDGLLAISVSNLNPQNHMGIALCNLTRMERGETWRQNENLTPAVGRLLQGLDDERLAIAAALGVEVRTLTQHFHLSFGAPEAPIAEQARWLHERGDATTGPTALDSRYVLEDVPYGLVPTAALGRMVGAPAPLHEAGVQIFSALYGRDFVAENELLPAIGFDRLSLDALRALCDGG